MRKPLASHIIGLSVLYCFAFCLIGILQFSNKSNFSITEGLMSIKGRYQQTRFQETGFLETSGEETLSQETLSQETEPSQKETHEEAKPVTGGIKLFFEGIEFNLREERGKGLQLSGTDGISPVNPELMLITENSARFTLPGGTVIIFKYYISARGTELQINAEFADNVSEVTIPAAPRRSSLVLDNEQIGILFGGTRYFLNSPGHEFEKEKIILSRDAPFLSYRERGKQKEFIPADYILAQAEDYDNIIRNWRESFYYYWNQNMYALQNEDDITAYLAEALQRGSYSSAVSAISANNQNNSRLTYKSSAYIGRMTEAFNMFTASENEKLNLFTRLARERSLALLEEEHIIDYLYTRGYDTLANDVIEIIRTAEPNMLSVKYCAGLLEAYADLRRWRSDLYIEPLTEQIFLLMSDNLNHDNENDTVHISTSDGIDTEYSLRLGIAVINWMHMLPYLALQDGANETNAEWTAIAKSLVLSSIKGSNSGRLHNMINPTQYSPRASLLTDSGHWAWTVSPYIRASYSNDGNMNLAFTLQSGVSHHIIIRGVRPFLRIQIHGLDWRSDSQFDRYDSSGWSYYPQEQILLLKIRHRQAAENIRLIYREAPRPVIVQPEPEASGEVLE